MHEGDAILGWQRAALDPGVAGALEAIYTDIAREIVERGPACWASGRCCNFAKTGHLLFVTGLEAAYTLARVRGRGGGLDDGAARIDVALSLPQIHAARARGDCPFLVDNACGVHGIKPLGCRVYFCDRSAQAWQQELSERGLDRIKRLHDTHGLVYQYGEWRAMLELVTSAA
jgi:Fe-S-cluster containining protein